MTIRPINYNRRSLCRAALSLFIAGLLLGQTARAQAPVASDTSKVSLRGVVRDASTGAPIADAEIRVVGAKGEATTDSAGQFTLSDLNLGQVQIRAFHFFLGGDVTQMVKVTGNPAQAPVELRLRTGGHISGRVTDPDGKPLAGIFVKALRRVYSMGKVEYVNAGGDDSTNANGEYFIDGIPAGRGYIIQATQDWSKDVKAISEEAEDPKLRKPVLAQTYYPRADAPERAVVVPLTSNDNREHIDIEMGRSAAYCVDGSAELKDYEVLVQFTVGGRAPAFGAARGTLGSDGKFRVCGLAPGEYSVQLNSRNNGSLGRSSGLASVQVVDRDVLGITLVRAPSTVMLSGQVAWAGTPPDPPPADAFVTAEIVGRAAGAAKIFLFVPALQPIRAPVPGTFSLEYPYLEGVGWRVTHLPAGAYVKDVTYNGASVMNEEFALSSGGSFAITLGQDGGRIEVKASDKDGKAVGESWVALMPVNAASEAALSAGLRIGRTDPQGAWTSEVLGSRAVFDSSYRGDGGSILCESIEEVVAGAGEGSGGRGGGRRYGGGDADSGFH